MSYSSYTMFYRSVALPGGWTLERSGTSWNPPFPSMSKGIILFALAVMTLQSVSHLVQAVRGRTYGNPGATRGETKMGLGLNALGIETGTYVLVGQNFCCC
jgi:hypothetical protein